MRISIWIVLAGCTSGVDRNIEPHITLDQGVYGQVTSVSDTEQPTTTFAGAIITAYDVSSHVMRASTVSDQRGIYQLELVPNSYVLCTGSCTPDLIDGRCCVNTDVLPGRQRHDWEATNGGGWWCDSGTCPG